MSTKVIFHFRKTDRLRNCGSGKSCLKGHFQANAPRIGHANAESARMLLGTVPVESDGFTYFKAPAKIPLYFQALDENGRAV
jgi:hypothetical protein